MIRSQNFVHQEQNFEEIFALQKYDLSNYQVFQTTEQNSRWFEKLKNIWLKT